MSESGVAVAQLSGWRAVSRYQWLVFAVVWAGWTLDAADFGLYSLVLRPAMIELLGGNPPLADIGKYGGLLAMTGLLGWALAAFCSASSPTTSAGCARWPSASRSTRSSPRCR